MNSYLITLAVGNVTAAGRFESVDAAEAAGQAQKDNFVILTDESDANQLSGPQMLALFNAATGKAVDRFSSRAAGFTRLYDALEHHDFSAGVITASAKGGAEPADKPETEKPVKVTKSKKAKEPKPAKAKNVKEPKAKKAKAQKAAKPKKESTGDRSAAIKESWVNPETAAKRSERTRVKVGGEEYRSVREAFTALKLPLNQHIKFRMELKEAGRKVFNHDGKQYHFTTVAE